MLDMFSDPALAGSHEPYVQFTADLVRRMQAPDPDTPGLRLITRFRLENRDQVLFRIVPEAVQGVTNNLAADWNGSRAIATAEQNGYPASNLNDGTDMAWGSVEGNTDVYAGVILQAPAAVTEIRLTLFTPEGRPHLRDLRIVAADSENSGKPEWRFVRARLKGSTAFSSVVTIPPSPDRTRVTIEIDRSDPQWRPGTTWGFACLRSRGDIPNYLAVGSGVYVRELEIE
jgi:hypothetical protein